VSNRILLMIIQLLNAYHHWVAVQYAVDTAVMAEVGDIVNVNGADNRSWQPEKLRNLCPACFDIEEEDLDQSVGLSLDGNLQHIRFKDKTSVEYEVLTPKLFVAYQQKQFDLAARNHSRVPETSCGHRFKATNGWNRTEVQTASKKHLAESGLMAATCFHGTNLRFLNIYGVGERQSHAFALLDAILEEIESDTPKFDKIKLCYDVACVFQSALWRRDEKWEEKLVARIGRFHLYGHELGCHVLFNILRTEGYGLTVGEEPEHLWYQISHLIRSGRVSSGPRRTQKIDSTAIYNAQRYRENMGDNLDRRWTKMLEMEKKSKETEQKTLDKCIPASVDREGNRHPIRLITSEYLREQANLQLEFYTNYK
jgi:hypothetical protein